MSDALTPSLDAPEFDEHGRSPGSPYPTLSEHNAAVNKANVSALVNPEPLATRTYSPEAVAVAHGLAKPPAHKVTVDPAYEAPTVANGRLGVLAIEPRPNVRLFVPGRVLAADNPADYCETYAITRQQWADAIAASTGQHLDRKTS